MKRNLIFIGLGLLVALSGCKSEHHEHHEQFHFVATSPIKMDTSFTKEYVCQIHSIQHIELRALEKGYLQNIYVDEGQFVKQGQMMFQIMPLLYEAEYHRAEAEVNFAEIEYQNTKALADSNIVAKAKFDKAKAELELAKVHLGFTEIKAPFDGIMDRFHVRRGSLIDEGELLSTLSDNSKMWVYFNVPEAEYLDYMADLRDDSNLQVHLEMANGKLFDQSGVVETIEAEFNNETGNISFRATFPNPTGLLRHGETGNVLLTSALSDVLIIPQKATYEVLEKKYVFVIDEEGIIHAREIQIGAELPHLFQVTAGLAANETILLEGLRLVHENEQVEFEFLDPKEVVGNLKLYAE